LKQHFINPQAFTVGSSMPSYAHLFYDRRGDDLIAYLSNLGLEKYTNRLEQMAEWQPNEMTSKNNGNELFAKHCVACHGTAGHGDGLMAGHFPKPPANLVVGPFIWSAAGDQLNDKLAKIIKFGIPGTDMPGHETLSDQDIASLRAYVLDLRKAPASN
jgi:cytochrome c